jgi:hypothetical protein
MTSSIARSPNCAAYTDTLSLLVDAEAFVPEIDNCRVTVPSTFSCQKSAFENPDEKTEEFMREKAVQALDEMGCDSSKMEMSFKTVLVGAQELEYSGEKLADLGMASNCYKVGNDPNDATHIIRAECTNQYEMTNERGQRIKNTNKKFLSNLAVCDVSDAAMPQLMEDARKVAAHNAGQNGYVADRDIDLACTFSILPRL